MSGEIELIVGLVSPIVTVPPNETAEPLIVIDELVRSAFAIAPSTTLTIVTDSLLSLDVDTIPSAKSSAVKAVVAGALPTYAILNFP